MTSTCPQCAMSLSLEDSRLPTEPFSVVCPRCRNTVTITPPPKEEERLTSAPKPGEPQGDLLRALAALLSNSGGQSQPENGEIQKWHRRRIVLCVEDAQLKERMRLALDPAKYELFMADLSQEAVEILHESRAQVMVLSPTFDAEHQGGAVMIQWANRLTPQARRRTYVILVSPQLRTLDTYLAFANGVNLTVHPEDIDSFQSIFERSVRDFNDLYKPLNQASQTDPF
jgi:hypothetical protein